MNKILSEQLKRSKQLMGINEDVAKSLNLPSLKATNGLLSIDGKRYRLKKGFLTITVHKVTVKNEEVTIVASAMGIAKQENKIRKSQVDKIVKEVSKDAETITVKNLDGDKFKLVKV